MSSTQRLSRYIVLSSILSLAASQAGAVDAGPVAIHGALSATFAGSDTYNYLGDTKNSLDLAVTEITLNGTHTFSNGVRFGAQIYAYELADYKDISIDFATLNYQFCKELQVAAGRVKRPFALYSTSQDLDHIRPMAFLPLDSYSKTFRPVGNAHDGLSVSGTIGLGRAGDLDYEVYGGWIPGYDADTPFAQSVNDSAPFLTQSVDTKMTWGGILSWSTPISGLRFGGGYMNAKLRYDGVAKTVEQMAVSPSESRYLPSKIGTALWASSIGGKAAFSEIDVDYNVISAEYVVGSWTFAAEYMYIRRFGDTTLPVLGRSKALAEQDGAYGMVTYEVSPKWQLGCYYAENYANINDRKGDRNVVLPKHRNWLKDFAFSISHSVSPNWIVKAEYHQLNGTKGVISSINGDAVNWSGDWNYYVLKTTFCF